MIAKILLVVFFIEVVSANHLYGIIGEAYHAPQPYKFGYQVKDKDSTQHRHEESDGHGNVRGSYGYTDDKGQYREVHYVADKGGFRAQVKTNEAGTANQNPAHVDVKADPPQHHFPHHHTPHVHIPHHEDIKIHHHIPHHQEVKFHHHVPHHDDIKIHHSVPHHEEVKFHHHIPHHPEIKFHHHIPHHHEEIKFNHHDVPHHHEEIKFNQHVPHHQFSHHDLKVEPIHGFKKHPSFESSLGGNGFNSFSPLHGFSYNPSAFHGYGQWPFQDSNTYGKQQTPWKKHEGFGGEHEGFGGEHKRFGEEHKGFGEEHKGFQGFNGLSGFDGDFVGLSSSNKGKYEEIMEKIKAYRKDGALGILGGFKDDTGNKFKNWKYGHENFDF